MGREVRRVPAGWEHPKDEKGRFVPLLGGSFKERIAQWDEEARQWANGFIRDFATGDWKPRGPEDAGSFAYWCGRRPDERNYMPDWSECERTHYQMYETTSEGTPISPVMEGPEVLARWLADNHASAFGAMEATYDQWLDTIKRGWAVGGVVLKTGEVVSGVEGLYGR